MAAVNGVFNSWETTAIKSLFALFNLSSSLSEKFRSVKTPDKNLAKSSISVAVETIISSLSPLLNSSICLDNSETGLVTIPAFHSDTMITKRIRPINHSKSERKNLRFHTPTYSSGMKNRKVYLCSPFELIYGCKIKSVFL